jgi:uncharacterized protein YecT (DUF1311 family)
MLNLVSLLVIVTLNTPVFTARAQGELALGCHGPDTSSSFESCVLEKKRSESEMKFRALYELRLKSAQTKNVALSLRAAQATWEKYRNKTCQFEQAEYGGINSISFVRCNERMAAERVRYFEGLP